MVADWVLSRRESAVSDVTPATSRAWACGLLKEIRNPARSKTRFDPAMQG